ncbi:hypothetical protein [Vibrio navarrensis]|uniref:hypothetical protein n=1 Tax=Vibrio navarrensis TaxID=29495 RepID=UPI0018DE13ED|nr:hypothetical protein [Vibrio navarrensis]MBH9740067.1 hypothetical protein [Vibrio navarrensis]
MDSKDAFRSIGTIILASLPMVSAAFSPVWVIVDPAKVNAKNTQVANESMKATESLADQAMAQLKKAGNELQAQLLRDKTVSNKVNAIGRSTSEPYNLSMQSQMAVIPQLCSSISIAYTELFDEDGCNQYELFDNRLTGTLQDSSYPAQSITVTKSKYIDNLFSSASKMANLTGASRSDYAKEILQQSNDVLWIAYGQPELPEITSEQKDWLDNYWDLMSLKRQRSIPLTLSTHEAKTTAVSMVSQFATQSAIDATIAHTYIPRTRDSISKKSQVSSFWNLGGSEDTRDRILNKASSSQTTVFAQGPRPNTDLEMKFQAIDQAHSLKRKLYVLEQKLATELMSAYKTKALKEVLENEFKSKNQ